MSGYLVWLILAIVSGIVCYFIAKKKGRDPALWFAAGIIFNILAWAVLSWIMKSRQEED
jgi:hypothetical protein